MALTIAIKNRRLLPSYQSDGPSLYLKLLKLLSFDRNHKLTENSAPNRRAVLVLLWPLYQCSIELVLAASIPIDQCPIQILSMLLANGAIHFRYKFYRRQATTFPSFSVCFTASQQDWVCKDLEENKTMDWIQVSHKATGKVFDVNFTKSFSYQEERHF